MEKIWLKSYVKDVPAEINPDIYQSLGQIIELTCKKFADRPAFYNFGKTLSFTEIDQYSLHFAAYLQQALHLKKSARVAIMLPNILQYPVVLFAVLRAGFIVVNVNPLYTARELQGQLKDSEAETIIVLSNFAHVVEEALPGTAVKNVIVTQFGDLLAFPKGLVIDLILRLKKKIPAWNITSAISFRHAMNKGKTFSFVPVEVKPEDIAFLQYTGGTTGVPKGAMLTHRNLIANILQAEAWFKNLIKLGHEIIITALPLYHVFSLMANGLFIFSTGGLNVLITNPRDIPLMIKEMSKFKFTAITGVNTLFNALLKCPKFHKLDFSALHLSLGGGAAVQQAVAEKWQQVTGSHLLEAYGLTETSPCVTVNPTNLNRYNGTIGLPVSSTDVAVLNENGQEVDIGQPGELAVKGPQVMLGYWHNAEETKKAFTSDGWFLTGDIVSIDKQGYVKVLERKKDMILVSGFNVYPNEIEDILVQMPGIAEAAVIGVPDSETGEAVKAFIVKENPDLTTDQILNFCRQKLTRYKVPKHIEFRDSVPKTNVGKILRRALKNSI